MVLLVNVCSLHLENRIVGAVFEPTRSIGKLYSSTCSVTLSLLLYSGSFVERSY